MRRAAATMFALSLLGTVGMTVGCREPSLRGDGVSRPVVVPASAAPAPSADAAPAAPGCPPRVMLTDWALSPDGRALLTSCAGEDCPDAPPDTAVEVWDLAKGEVALVLDAGDNDVSVSWPSKDFVMAEAQVSTWVKKITIWDAHTFEVVHAQPYYRAFTSVDAQGRQVLFTGADGAVELFDAPTRKVVARPAAEAHLGTDVSVQGSFSEDGQRVYVDDDSAGFQLLDALTLKRRTVAAGSVPVVDTDGVSPGGLVARPRSNKRFALLERSGALKLLDATLSARKTVAPAGTFKRHGDLRFVDEERLQLRAEDGSLKLFDLTSAKVARVFAAAPPAKVPDAKVADAEEPCEPWVGTTSDSFARLAVTRSDCAVDVVDGKTLATKWTIAAVRPGPSGQPPVPALQFSPDEHHLAAIFGERLLVVYDAESGREESRLQLPAGMSQMSAGANSYRSVPLGWTADSRFVVVAQGEVFFVRPGDGAFVVLGMFARGDQRVSVVATETEVEGPPELAGCAFQKPGVAESTPVARRAAPFVLGRFLSAR